MKLPSGILTRSIFNDSLASNFCELVDQKLPVGDQNVKIEKRENVHVEVIKQNRLLEDHDSVNDLHLVPPSLVSHIR